MNFLEYRNLCADKVDGIYTWYNKARHLLLSRKYESLENCDKDAAVIHHLRDTEEQRKYND